MILAAGLSPAWQHVLVVDRFQGGEVNRLSERHSCASGKVVNVGLALHHLSGRDPAQTLTLAPVGGPPFEWIDDDLARLGMPRQFIRTAAATRVCTTILDRSSFVPATELVENAHPIAPAELEEFMAAFAQSAAQAQAAVLTGSTPPRAPTDVFRSLIAAARCPVVLDARGPQLLAALDAGPFLVKPNRRELADTLGRSLDRDEDLRQAMLELHRRGARAVAVTSGGEPTWVLSGGQFHQLAPKPVSRVVNPIGCGDCLAAGVAWALGHGADPVSAVSSGMELAAANLQTLLPARFASDAD